MIESIETHADQTEMVSAGTPLAEPSHHMHNASMPSITIRDVPGDTRDELASRAAATGRSLQQFLRAELIRLAQRPDNATILARAAERRRQTGEGFTTEQIRELRAGERDEAGRS
jgi:antitoxin FitA